jgi:AbrB family looped-hinge helix DNA binding protein
MTLPKAIRVLFNLKPGDRIDVTADGDRIILVPRAVQLEELCAVLPRPERVVSVKEMDAAIALRRGRRAR